MQKLTLLLSVGALGLVLAAGSWNANREQQAQLRADRASQARQATKLAAVISAERQEATALTIAIAQRDQAQAQLRETTDALNASTAERDELKEKVAALERAASVGLGSGPVAVASSAGPNHFMPGQCTWYVASRRSVPWFGNAGQWLGAAQAYGFPTGWAPRPGAIMVTRESWYGHVAIVESVNGSWWTVSEMNFVAPYVVDSRTLTYGKVPLAGFIY